MDALPARLYLRTLSEAVLWPPPLGAAYVDAPPSDPLRPFVARLHLCREHVPEPIDEWIVPDGAVSLHFNFGDAPGAGDACEVAGPTLVPEPLRLAGDLESVGARLRAGAIPAVLGVPAGALTGRVVALEELWGARAIAEAHERLAAAPHGPARLAVLEAILLERIGVSERDRDRTAAEAVRRIGAAGGRIRVRALAEALGVGERRLGQVFRDHVGLSPKETCRLVRLRAGLALARAEPDASWGEVALRAGYFDQAHLGNEVRRLTGLTPTALRSVLAPQGPAARLLASGHRT